MKWLSAGANFGVSNQTGRTDWIAGGEVSVGSIKELLWAGAYLDAVYGSGADSVRLSVGPEVGFLFLAWTAASWSRPESAVPATGSWYAP
jgi:hypothetical protein